MRGETSSVIHRDINFLKLRIFFLKSVQVNCSEMASKRINRSRPPETKVRCCVQFLSGTAQMVCFHKAIGKVGTAQRRRRNRPM